MHQNAKPIKLHLGCGEVYLDGWVNIDAPGSDAHGIKADIYTDISELSYPDDSVDEIVMNAVFEHFQRHEALKNLRKFYGWLKEGGKIEIAVPEFWGTIRKIKMSKSEAEKSFWYRHLFGPQDHKLYGNHYDGFDKSRLREIFKQVGFTKLKITVSGGMPYIRVEATKTRPFLHDDMYKKNVVNYLLCHEYQGKPTTAFYAWLDAMGLRNVQFEVPDTHFGTQTDRFGDFKKYVKSVLGAHTYERLKALKHLIKK